MSLKFGKLMFETAIKNPKLFAKPVLETIQNWKGNPDDFLVAEINPEFSDSLAFCREYDIPLDKGANCLIVEAKRGGEVKYAACLVPINSRANINSAIRKHLNARTVSLASKEFAVSASKMEYGSITIASKEFAVSASKMEYGSITIVGLPAEWPLLIDESLTHIDRLIVGRSLRHSKLLIPGKILSELSNAYIIQRLSNPVAI